MKKDDLDLEMEEMLKNARPLSEIDLEGLAEANRAISRDPRHIAAVMKGVFVNDILCAMHEKKLNKSQLAVKWGKTRQYLNSVLDRENPGNFTIDTIVSLSMTLGLVPQRIELKPLEVPVEMTLFRPALDLDLWQKWCVPDECTCADLYAAKQPDELYHVGSVQENLEEIAA